MKAALLMLVLSPPGLSVSWDAPPTCPDADALLHRIQRHQSSAAATELRVEGRAQRRGDAWALRLRIDGDDGVDVRVLEGETCEAVTDAAALIVALRLSQTVVPPPKAPEPEPEPEPEPQPRVPVQAPRSPVPPGDAAPSQPNLQGWLSVAGGVALGVLPGVGGAVAIDGGLGGRLWRVGLGARGFVARRAAHPQAPGVSGRFDLVTGSVVGCGVPAAGPVRFPLCGRVEVGGLRGVGDAGVVTPQPQWSPWVGGAVSVSAAWSALPWLAPFIAAEGVAGFVRPGFSAGTAPGTLYEARVLGFRAWLGLEFDFVPQKPGRAETQ